MKNLIEGLKPNNNEDLNLPGIYIQRIDKNGQAFVTPLSDFEGSFALTDIIEFLLKDFPELRPGFTQNVDEEE